MLRIKKKKKNPSMIGSIPNHSENDNAFSHMLFWVPSEEILVEDSNIHPEKHILL